jgi:acyl-CoA thioesterase
MTTGRGPIDQTAARIAFERAASGGQEAFGDFFLARLLGFEISYPDEACEVKFAVHDFMFNPQGTLHGGTMTTALDVSMGHLLNRLAGPGATLEFKIQFFAPVRIGFVTCRAEMLRRGRSVWSLIRPPAKPDPA